jgi:hypothetical protein
MRTSRINEKKAVLVCGDSVFDNTPYVGEGGRDFHSHLSELVDGWEIAFRALDGAVARQVINEQIETSDSFDAVVLSVGGNNALQHLPLLESPESMSFLEMAQVLADIQGRFRKDYAATLRQAGSASDRLLVATIYRPRFHLDGYPEQVIFAIEPLLSVFNDVIQEEARRAGAELLDLREISVSDDDFANPIEPSDAGGRKIASKISDWLHSIALSK